LRVNAYWHGFEGLDDEVELIDILTKMIAFNGKP
jgi:hypothetical protein